MTPQEMATISSRIPQGVAHFSVRLRACRYIAALTRKQLADLTSLSPRTILRLEEQRTRLPSTSTITAIATALQIPETWLMDGITRTPENPLYIHPTSTFSVTQKERMLILLIRHNPSCFDWKLTVNRGQPESVDFTQSHSPGSISAKKILSRATTTSILSTRSAKGETKAYFVNSHIDLT